MSRFLFTGYIFILITDQFDVGTHFCGKKTQFFIFLCFEKHDLPHSLYIDTRYPSNIHKSLII